MLNQHLSKTASTKSKNYNLDKSQTFTYKLFTINKICVSTLIRWHLSNKTFHSFWHWPKSHKVLAGYMLIWVCKCLSYLVGVCVHDVIWICRHCWLFYCFSSDLWMSSVPAVNSDLLLLYKVLVLIRAVPTIRCNRLRRRRK